MAGTYTLKKEIQIGEKQAVTVKYTMQDGGLLRKDGVVGTTVDLNGIPVPAKVNEGSFFKYGAVSVELGKTAYEVGYRTVNIGGTYGSTGRTQRVLGLQAKNGTFIYGIALSELVTGQRASDPGDAFNVAETPAFELPGVVNYGGVGQLPDGTFKEAPGIPNLGLMRKSARQERRKNFSAFLRSTLILA